MALHISLEHTKRLSFRNNRGRPAEFPLNDSLIESIKKKCLEGKEYPSPMRPWIYAVQQG